MTLCVKAGCWSRGNHWDDCSNADCPGCTPRLAANRSRLCELDLRHLGEDIAALPELDDALLHILTGGNSTGEKIASKPGPRLPNQRALGMRHEIRNTLVTWCRVVIEELRVSRPTRLTVKPRPDHFIGPMPIVRLPDDTVAGAAKLLGLHVNWLSNTDYAAEVASVFADLRPQARSAAYPSGTRAYDVAPCPMDCGGVIKAVLRRTDSLLPSELVCDTDEQHRWNSTQWVRLGRTLLKAAA